MCQAARVDRLVHLGLRVKDVEEVKDVEDL